jgi:hypothetical protein
MPAEILRSTWTRPTLVIIGERAPTTTSASSGIWDLGDNSINGQKFYYLTDDSRSEVRVTIERIEYKKRMINGRMRAYHVADKKSFGINWTDLPTSKTIISEYKTSSGRANIAAAKELLEWYEDHTGSFYLSLVYDNTQSASAVPLKYRMETYNVFFDDFSYVIKNRGPTHDMWDVSINLVEV